MTSAACELEVCLSVSITQSKSVQNVFSVDTLTIYFAYFIKYIMHSADWKLRSKAIKRLQSCVLRSQDEWDRGKTGVNLLAPEFYI